MSNVTLEKVSRSFGAFVAVDAIDLEIGQGELVTLLGPSGCGKTTTLRMIAGLEHATGGAIRIGGNAVSDPAAGVFVAPERRALGMVFQSYAIWPHMTVFDNVAYPLKIRRRPAQQVKEQVARTLRLVEMEHLAERPATDLSGGQQQRIAIARALVFEPQVLLMDEPMSNLDARLRTQMGDDFRELQRRLGITTIYVTHDQSEAMSLSDRVVVMHQGKVLQIGSPEEVYHRPSRREVAEFFGSPNMLDARVEACRAGAGGFEVDVAGEGFSGTCRAAASMERGAGVLVMVRPEDLRIVAGQEAPGMSWEGRVEDSVFRGAVRSLTVDCAGRRFSVSASPRTAIRPGDRIRFAVEDGAAWALGI